MTPMIDSQDAGGIGLSETKGAGGQTSESRKKIRPKLVREQSHDILQALEMALGPDQQATMKCWKNIASKYDVDPIELNHLATQPNKVTTMFCNHHKFVDYEFDQLLADLKEFGRTDVLKYLKEKCNVG